MLEVEGLHAGYERIPILAGVSFSVAEGEFVGVLGHNGMGKTTLLKTVIGELRATRGTIRFAGRDVTRASTAERARAGMGYVPQARAVFPDLSVRENLRMGEIHADGASAVPELLGYFPILEQLLDRPARALSGGERQILALARSLAGRPKLLLLDEPSDGVQPSIVDDIAERLQALMSAWNLTVLMVEQDLQIMATLAQRVFVMQKGRITGELPLSALDDPAAVSEFMGL